MRQVRVKPESFKYFSNSQTYYLNAIVLDPVLEEGLIILQKGLIIQLTFTSEVLGQINLPDSRKLIFVIEKFAQEVYSRGHRVLRFTVNKIDENDQRRSD